MKDPQSFLFIDLKGKSIIRVRETRLDAADVDRLRLAVQAKQQTRLGNDQLPDNDSKVLSEHMSSCATHQPVIVPTLSLQQDQGHGAIQLTNSASASVDASGSTSSKKQKPKNKM
ncbi:MAG: hypothetical protein V4568_07120 [Pseudomonadota bacterium]